MKGILEVCESSLLYTRSLNQDENKNPTKKQVPLLDQEKRNGIPFTKNRTKQNPIIGMVRAHTSKGIRKMPSLTKKPEPKVKVAETVSKSPPPEVTIEPVIDPEGKLFYSENYAN